MPVCLERIAASDAPLIVSPEYNYSIPGVLRNAIDWASRPPDTSPLGGKPVAIMGASAGILGTARAQYHLRQVAVFTSTLPLDRPEVFITLAHTKFDEAGDLLDDDTRERMRHLLEALVPGRSGRPVPSRTTFPAFPAALVSSRIAPGVDSILMLCYRRRVLH